ncbi:unnamed protein product [Polarella glacialis]|uniref:U3 small nucleolar RNA-associated protein 15 C-terminal domain-containing protein n=1 Tax=Polarella glacialis TaxID=89957 RepID=A0A813GAD4_POLGL|nr:unnamed protein product [Polarella glacialis]
MGDAFELKPVPQPRRVAELAPEAQVFKAYRPTFKHQEISRILALAYSPTSPHRLAVVSGTKVGVWQHAPGGKDGELQESATMSKFKDVTQCVSWRSDGRLMLAGEAGGSCALIETETKNVLRRFRGHEDAVTCASFATADKSRCATGSKDGKLRIWDVATSELLHTVEAHKDCMKTLVAGPAGPDSWITAGYDGYVRLWDARVPLKGESLKAVPVASANHGHPIEAGVAFPGGALFASAGGPAVKVWDLACAGRLVQELPDAHSKAITGICLDSKASILLTASFDGLAKVYHAADLSHIWTYRLPGPATCCAWPPDDRGFVVGLDDGTWHVKMMKKATADPAKVAEGGPAKSQKKWVKREGFLRGEEHQPGSDDEVVDQNQKKRKKEHKIDFFFRKFEYRKAFEYMLKSSTDPSTGLAIVDQLLQQGVLASALNGLEEEVCLDALRWFVKAFATGDSLQRSLFDEALHSLVEGNRCLRPPCTPELIDALQKLEIKAGQRWDALIETNGMIETLLGFVHDASKPVASGRFHETLRFFASDAVMHNVDRTPSQAMTQAVANNLAVRGGGGGTYQNLRHGSKAAQPSLVGHAIDTLVRELMRVLGLESQHGCVGYGLLPLQVPVQDVYSVSAAWPDRTNQRLGLALGLQWFNDEEGDNAAVQVKVGLGNAKIDLSAAALGFLSHGYDQQIQTEDDELVIQLSNSVAGATSQEAKALLLLLPGPWPHTWRSTSATV